MERIETSIEGISIIRNVNVRSADPNVDGSILHFTGITRSTGGATVQCYRLENEGVSDLDKDDYPQKYHKESDLFLGSLYIYATISPSVEPEAHLPLEEGRPPPLEPEPYQSFIDLSEKKELWQLESSMDVLLIVVGPDGKPSSNDDFKFENLEIQTSGGMSQ